MGSFVYMIARDDADIIKEKRLEFEERLEKVFNLIFYLDDFFQFQQRKK